MAKTTLSLPDEMLARLKIHAIRTKTTIKDILQRLVETELKSKKS